MDTETARGGDRDGERGMALVLTMFMVLIVSLVGASAMVTARSQTLSSLSYRTAAQSRYAAESGVHAAINYLMFTYAKPGTAGDPLAAYDLTRTPVSVAGADVVLSSDASVAANYPVTGVKDGFNAAAHGTLTIPNSAVSYGAHATLRSMRQITDAFSGQPVTVQSWEVTGTGTIPGAGSAAVEVSAILEQQVVPMFRYAAFATSSGCAALSFAGGATTDSYDSRAALAGPTPALTSSDGNVGTNGNLDEVGNPTVIHGALSTPRSGVGKCTDVNVTALTISGKATVDDGLIELPQNVAYPTPALPDPLPPTDAVSFKQATGCPAGVPFCAPSANGATISPATPASVVTLGNVDLAAKAQLHLNAGIYVVNSLKMVGNSKLIIDSGPVIFKVVGTDETTPIDLTGGSVSNPTYKPSDLQFIYGGTGNVRVAGGAEAAELIYAPNANTAITGNADFYGSVVTGILSDTGGTSIHYDRALEKMMLTPGNTVMSQFTWKAF